MMLANDAEMMRLVRDGNEDAFQQLMDKYLPGLVRHYIRIVRDPALADDLSQEVFMRVYTHRKDYFPRAKFTSYLYRIARNCWIDHLRRTRQERKNKSLDATYEDGRRLSDRLAGEGGDPEEQSAKTEEHEAITKAIEALPEDHKTVFMMSEVDGMKYHEISKKMKIPVGTVKSRMFHAVRRLKRRLARSA